MSSKRLCSLVGLKSENALIGLCILSVTVFKLFMYSKGFKYLDYNFQINSMFWITSITIFYKFRSVLYIVIIIV